MHRAIALGLILLLASVAAQNDVVGDESVETSPALAVLVHHPYPDASDPLGVEFAQGTDAYWFRYQHLDTDGVKGFDFPHTVFDGVVAIEGIPEGAGPYVATQEAYTSAYASRAQKEAPVDVFVSTGLRSPDNPGGTPGTMYVHVGTETQADLSGNDLHVWAAVVEDPVHYEPPPALSNGVFVHPFVVRGVHYVGPLHDHPPAVPFSIVEGDGPQAWDMDRIGAVAWIQQGPSNGLQFDAHEVVQAAMHVPSAEDTTLASSKVVLMEMYSATWCDTCLFGDKVAEEMAVEYGIERDLDAAGVGYLRDGPWVLGILGAVAVGMAVAWPRLGGRT